MTNCNLPVLARDAERLRLENRDLACGRIAHVADRARALQSIEMRLVEGVGNVTHRALEAQLRAIRCDDATRFLAAMLKRVEAEISQSCSFRVSVDSKHSTLFTQLCDLDFSQLIYPGLPARGLRLQS